MAKTGVRFLLFFVEKYFFSNYETLLVRKIYVLFVFQHRCKTLGRGIMMTIMFAKLIDN